MKRSIIWHWKSTVLFYIATIVIVACLSVLQAFLLGASDIIQHATFFQVAMFTLYWIVVTTVFFEFVIYQKHRAHDEPMRRLSEAAKHVAAGDFSVYVQPMHAPDKYNHIDVMFQDFNKMVQDLGSLETMKSDFIASVSHEIKTPLNTIQSYASALQDRKLPTRKRVEYTDTIMQASYKLSALVTNILKLNRLENQSTALNVQSFDLCRQLSESILSFEAEIERKNIKLRIHMDDCATITTDAGMLDIVWHNLLSNALKFTESGGKIIVTQTSTDRYVTVSVTDTGYGMNDETRAHIFDKFYQGDVSHSSEGNGLGLSLTEKVIELLSGIITVNSELGEGSTFTVTLPIDHK